LPGQRFYTSLSVFMWYGMDTPEAIATHPKCIVNVDFQQQNGSMGKVEESVCSLLGRLFDLLLSKVQGRESKRDGFFI